MEDFIKPRALHPLTLPHIGIIGAGVAGLRCADILLQYGFQVTILEGRDRVGGRMHQTYLRGTEHLVDTGPNWIHGTDNNPMLELAKDTKTDTHSWGEKLNLIDEDGNYVADPESAEYNDLMWGIIIEAFKHSNKEGVSIPASQSLYDFFGEKVQEHLPETQRDYEKRRKIILQMSEMWGGFVGGTIEKQSLKFFWLEETLEGENLFCAGTYQNILKLISKPAIEKATIRFSTKAMKIDAQIYQGGRVIVSTDKAENLEFDEVVVTTPLGWLKKNQNAFSPPLPDRISAAINSIGYGCLEKVYISFSRAFWLPHPNKRYKIHQSNGMKDVGEPSSTGFTQFLSPKYDPDNPCRWIQDCLELATLPGSSAHPTLLFYIFGEQSRDIASELSKHPSESDRHDLVIKLFYPYFSRLKGFSDSDPDCIPTASYATEWLNDELAGNGSYSNFEVGLEEGDKDIEAMREGMPGRGIWLAGEHTAPFVASGTVTGAYWSGEAVARRIAQAYGIPADGKDVPSEKDKIFSDW